MDIDCDGVDDKAGDCSNDPSGYGETAFKYTVQSYGIRDLNANTHPYVVFNEPPFFNPEKYGMKPLSVMAVVCNDQVVSLVFISAELIKLHVDRTLSPPVVRRLGRHKPGAKDWRDIHFPCSALLSNEHLNGSYGHGDKDVLYIGFTGDEAVPGKNGANWKAKNVREFEDSIKGLGDKLVARLPA